MIATNSLIRSVTRSSTVVKLTSMTASKSLSTQTTQAMAKLQAILEDYRVANYTQEVPTRFKKDICRAASTGSSATTAQGLERVLVNIGAGHLLSSHEVHSIFSEMGNAKGEIPTMKLAQLL